MFAGAHGNSGAQIEEPEFWVGCGVEDGGLRVFIVHQQSRKRERIRKSEGGEDPGLCTVRLPSQSRTRSPALPSKRGISLKIHSVNDDPSPRHSLLGASIAASSHTASYSLSASIHSHTYICIAAPAVGTQAFVCIAFEKPETILRFSAASILSKNLCEDSLTVTTETSGRNICR